MVLADGCFDCLHVGHIDYLEAAAMFGALMVRVAPDSDILDKGRVPFQHQAERMVLMQALRCVETVVASPTLADAVREWRPSHLVKGKDWAGRLPEEVIDACLDCCTKIVFVDTVGRTSTERLH